MKPSSEFAPGAGMIPPVLAGREKEKAIIRTELDRLGAGLRPKTNIALIGPRGNGKTVLLRWVEAQIARRIGNIKCEVLNPSCFESLSELINALADKGVFAALAGEGFSANINLFGSGVGISRHAAAKKLLRPVLENRCSEGTLVILIDEAHTLDHYPDVARAFFNDVQELAGNGRPLLLILAGTPNISTRLKAIEATFWNRLKKIGIGLLEAAAAGEALRIPLERMGYRIRDNALKQAANEAQRYPYFIQIVGDALHEAAKAESDMLESGKEIGDAILKQALKESQIIRNNYYSDRYRELREEGMLPAAEAVARRFVSQKQISISTAAFEVAVAESISPKMEELARSSGGIEPAAWFESRLRDVGVVWSQIGDEHMCEPGIPSLMDYIVERAREREHELRQIRESRRPDFVSE